MKENVSGCFFSEHSVCGLLWLILSKSCSSECEKPCNEPCNYIIVTRRCMTTYDKLIMFISYIKHQATTD